ncbi:hypothetical protein [Streptomyces flavidovirens]|uniref:hypothetical protein n=1 Tax=Streptomyces flavidovirens TaxID=67298 RepID=UPI00368F4D8D
MVNVNYDRNDLVSEIERAVFDRSKALIEKLLQFKRGEGVRSASLRDAVLSGLASSGSGNEIPEDHRVVAAPMVSVLVAEVLAGMLNAQKIPPSGVNGEAAPFIINSPGARLTMNTSQAGGNGSSVANFRDEEFNGTVPNRSRRIWEAIVGVMTIAGTAAVIVELFI